MIGEVNPYKSPLIGTPISRSGFPLRRVFEWAVALSQAIDDPRIEGRFVSDHQPVRAEVDLLVAE